MMRSTLEAMSDMPSTITASRVKYSPVLTCDSSSVCIDIKMTITVAIRKINLKIRENGSRAIEFRNRLFTSSAGDSQRAVRATTRPPSTQYPTLRD